MFGFYTVKGTSMCPTISDNSSVFVCPAWLGPPISLGDVVAAKVAGHKVIKRVIGVKKNGGVYGEALLSGDSSGLYGWVDNEAIIGKVIVIKDGSKRGNRGRTREPVDSKEGSTCRGSGKEVESSRVSVDSSPGNLSVFGNYNIHRDGG